MAKKIDNYIKLQIPAGSANPSPPVGPALGQRGVNIMEFCKSFNKKTENLEKGIPTPVIITVYSDRSFSFDIKTPPASVLLKKAMGIKSGSDSCKKTTVGTITSKKIDEIAKVKSVDMTCANLDAVKRCIKGTAYSMGLVVED